MNYPVLVPQLGPQAETGVLVAWDKAEGDTVKAGDVLFELESSKVVSEIEAEHDGVLSRILVPAGENVDPGATVAEIREA